MKRILVILIAVLVLASTAQARTSRLPLPKLIAAGNLPGCLQGKLTNPAPYMRKFHATILRVVVNTGYKAYYQLPAAGLRGQALPCIRAARAEGYKVMLVVQWESRWSVQRVRQLFTKEMKIYGPYLWAVGVGNEEEITPSLTGPGYSRDWRAVEPLLKKMVPRAIRVGGEISPWGLPYLEAALRAGLPGVQALAVHPFSYKWEFTMPQVLGLAHRYGLPLWCDEGLYDGPDSWRPSYPRGGKDLTLSQMRGVALAGVWDRY